MGNPTAVTDLRFIAGEAGKFEWSIKHTCLLLLKNWTSPLVTIVYLVNPIGVGNGIPGVTIFGY